MRQISLSAVTESTSAMLTQNADLFMDSALVFLAAISLMLLIFFFAESVAVGGIQMHKLMRLVLSIIGVKMLLVFYANPIPGYGSSAYHLITDQASWMVRQLDTQTMSDVMNRIQLMADRLERPSIAMFGGSIIELFTWLVYMVVLFGSAIATYGVIALSIAFQSILIVLGPFFLPFFIVPGFEHLAWNWIKSLIATSFVQVIASAYVWCFAKLLLGNIETMGDFSAGDMAVNFFAFVIYFVTFVFGVFKIPSMCRDLFAGAASGHALPFGH